MNYKRNTYYFKKKAMGLVFLSLLLGGLLIYFEQLVATLFIIAPATYLVIDYNLRPKDNEIDQVVHKQVEKITNYLLSDQAISNTHSDTDYVVEEAYYFQAMSERPFKAKKGTDKRFRSSHYEVKIFLFLNDLLIYKNVRFSIVEDMYLEYSDEYYYEDIVSVRTDTAHKNIPQLQQRYTVQKITLTTKGSNSVSMSFKDQPKINAVLNKIKTRLRHLKKNQKLSDESI